MTKNPFYMLNLAAESMATIHEFRVDRETELSLCRNAILERHHNILLYGERGIGKTFLIRLLEDELKEQNDVFCIRIQLSALYAYGRDNEATSFSRAILLQLCAEIWRRVLKKPYLELRERLEESGQEVTIRNDAERVVQEVYTHLMFSLKKARFDIQNMVGFSAGAKGEKKKLSLLRVNNQKCFHLSSRNLSTS